MKDLARTSRRDSTRNAKNIIIEGTRILWPNFTGRVEPYNPLGDRMFNVLLSPALAEQMHNAEWNVRWLEPLEEGGEPQAHINIKVQFGRIPPKIVMVTEGTNHRTILTEDMVGLLDHADIAFADVVVRPYRWEVNGKTGIKAYLKTLYVTLYQDEFELKYADPLE